jgi:ribosomal protein S18 acetylase RimI-like enzyme
MSGDVMSSIERYHPGHFDGIRSLWEEAFPNDPPWNRAEAAIPAKLAVQPELFLVAIEDGAVVGTAMAGYDGNRGWLYAVAVRLDRRRAGVGTALVRHCEALLKAMGCGKINLQLRATNEAVLRFYERLAMRSRTGSAWASAADPRDTAQRSRESIKPGASATGSLRSVCS